MKLATVLLLLVLPGSAVARHLSAPADVTVAYPEGYRSWVHIKSALISPAHQSFASIGGFQHIYANAQGTVGYRTRAFPEGSIVVFDWLEMREGRRIRGGAAASGRRDGEGFTALCHYRRVGIPEIRQRQS